VIGASELLSGCGAALFLRGGTIPDVTAVAEQARDRGDPFELMFLVKEAAQARALAEHRDLTFPLSVGRMLLGGLLLVASGLALGGRPGSRGLAFQALAANAAFVVLEYALTQRVRGTWIELLARAGAVLPADLPERQSLMNPALWWTFARFRLVIIDLGALAAAALALTRERSAAYFRAIAAALEEEEERKEP
jgi:hypothetical protein